MVNDHADESAYYDSWIHRNHRAVALSLSNIVPKQLVDSPHKLLKKHLRQLVSLESGVQQQTLKLGIAFVVLERAHRQSFKHRAVVFFLKRLSHHRLGIHRVARTRFMIEN